jgi:hypothetical protein
MPNVTVAYFLTFAFMVMGILCKAQQATVAVDTAAYSVTFDQYTIVVDNEVQDRAFWLALLAKDTTFISYFKSIVKTSEAFTIFIKKVERPLFLAFTYEFKIFMRPTVFDNKRLGQQLSGLGYVYYNVMLLPTPQKSYDIIRVEQSGIEI